MSLLLHVMPGIEYNRPQKNKSTDVAIKKGALKAVNALSPNQSLFSHIGHCPKKEQGPEVLSKRFYANLAPRDFLRQIGPRHIRPRQIGPLENVAVLCSLLVVSVFF